MRQQRNTKNEKRVDEPGIRIGTYLVKIENEVKFAHISEILVEHLDKQVDSFQTPQFVVIDINAQREE